MKIALIGTFDVDNYGDCLFPYILEKALNEFIGASVQLELFSPTDRGSLMGAHETLQDLPGTASDAFLKELESFDLVMLAGGDTVWSGEKRGTYSFLNFHEMSAGMRLWVWPFLFQHKYAKPGVIFSPGIGKLSIGSRSLLRENFRSLCYFSVRDKVSAGKIADDVVVDPDIAFSLPLIYPKAKLEPKLSGLLPSGLASGEYIVCQISSSYLNDDIEDYIKAVVLIAGNCKKKILLMPLCLFLGDEYLLLRMKETIERRGGDAFYVNPIKVESIMTVIACSYGYIGTSLHGTITSYAYGNKTVVISGGAETKHKGVMSVVGGEKIVVQRFADIGKAWGWDTVESAANAAMLSKRAFLNLFTTINSSKIKPIPLQISQVEHVIEIECAQYTFFDKFKIMIHKWISYFGASHAMLMKLKLWLKLSNVR